MRTLLGLLAVFCIVSGSFNANANLIINGSFEDNWVKQRGWRVFNSDDVLGWQGSNIEIWHNLQGFAAFEGSQHIELNSHGQRGQPFSIYQTFATQDGGLYDYSFAYSARRNSKEAFELSFLDGEETIKSTLFDDHKVKQWQTFDSTFVATSALTTLRFSAVWPVTSTMGNLIDDIRVTQRVAQPLARLASTPVNAPAIFGVLFAGLGFIALRKTKRLN